VNLLKNQMIFFSSLNLILPIIFLKKMKYELFIHFSKKYDKSNRNFEEFKIKFIIKVNLN